MVFAGDPSKGISDGDDELEEDDQHDHHDLRCFPKTS